MENGGAIVLIIILLIGLVFLGVYTCVCIAWEGIRQLEVLQLSGCGLILLLIGAMIKTMSNEQKPK